MSGDPQAAVSDDGRTGSTFAGALRRLTAARVALGRHGASLPTSPQLALQAAHAAARDAVHAGLDAEALRAALGAPAMVLHSAAPSRAVYLQRPDLGRRLDDASREALLALPHFASDLAFVIADGLSALAIQQHAGAFLSAILPRLQADGFSIAPLAIALQARVAIGDEIGAMLHARTVVMLIGERPGLSSPDSMGIYMTWQPRPGLTDEARNCISNVRPAGLSYQAAAYRLHYLLDQARHRQLSGVQLKDETAAPSGTLSCGRNFLVL